MRLIPDPPARVAPGAVHLPGWLDAAAQDELAASCRRWVEAAGGLRAPRMPRGGMMSVQIACLGWHWYPYRYSRTVDDDDGRPVARFPEELSRLSRRAVADAHGVDPMVTEGVGPAGEAVPAGEGDSGGEGGPAGFRPDVALINWYGPGARMGMHADRDERCTAPVVSLSLGDRCIFRFGTTADRGRPWTDVVLESGDLFVFGGPSRLAYHGVPKVVPGSGDPSLTGGGPGRWNITIRETNLPTAPGSPADAQDR